MKALVKLPDLFDGMNSLEKRRAVELEALKRDGRIHSWSYEKVTLKLADDTRYTPDFFIVNADGSIVCEEVKGFWRDDAKVKIKVAAEQFPYFHFQSFENDRGGWKLTTF